MPPLTPPHTPPLHPMTPHSLASLGSPAQHRHSPAPPPLSACLPDLVPQSPKWCGSGGTHSSPPPQVSLRAPIQKVGEDNDEFSGTGPEPLQLPRDETSLQERDEATLQEQRQELRALLLQDLANFRQGHGYLMAKELEEKVAALRLSKSVLHRVKILHYLRLRERHSGSLHPALLSTSPDTLPPRRQANLRRPRARAGTYSENSPQIRSLSPIPEEDTVETPIQEHSPQHQHYGISTTQAETCQQEAMPSEAPKADLPNRSSPYATGHERPSLKRRFLKKNEKILPQDLPTSPNGTEEGPLRVSSISRQYVASDRLKATEPHPSSLGKMVLKIEINCMNPWADASKHPSESTTAPGSPLASAASRHTTVTDIILDAAAPLASPCPTSTIPLDSSYSNSIGPKEASVLPSAPHQSPPASPEPSTGLGESLNPVVVSQEHPPDAPSFQVLMPSSLHEPVGDEHLSQPRPLSSGPTDYLTWAAEVTREEASRLGSPGIPA